MTTKFRNRGAMGFSLIALVFLTTMKDSFNKLDRYSAYLVAQDGGHTTGPPAKNKMSKTSPTFLATSNQSSSFQPLSCSDIFYEDRNKERPYGDPNAGGLHARYTTTDPPFWISLHDRSFDRTRWGIMVYGNYYENLESKSFVKIVRSDVDERRQRPIRMIDVGGNIGWYTMVVIAAAMERDHPIIVDVFEPNPRNHRRLCESLFLNEWLRQTKITVNLFPLGVTSNIMAEKMGTGRLDITSSGKGSLRAMDWGNTSGTATLPLTSLDRMAEELDWMDPNQMISILKVDVEGFELDVFQGAQKLLQSKTVQNVFFEGNLRTENEVQKFHSMVKLLITNNYRPYKIGGFRGANRIVKTNWTASMDKPGLTVAEIENRTDTYVDDLRTECTTIRRKQCNFWWRPI